MNPDGYELRTRENANAVDLNRDFLIGYQENIGEYIKYKDEIQFKV